MNLNELDVHGVRPRNRRGEHELDEWHRPRKKAPYAPDPWDKIESGRVDVVAPGPRYLRSQGDLRKRFTDLAQQWEDDTLLVSSTNELVMHPAYQSVIGLGLQAVPLILEHLERTSAPWFWALHHITGADPAPRNSTVSATVEAWLLWGDNNGYLR